MKLLLKGTCIYSEGKLLGYLDNITVTNFPKPIVTLTSKIKLGGYLGFEADLTEDQAIEYFATGLILSTDLDTMEKQ